MVMSKKQPIYAGVKPMFPYNPCMVVGDDIWVAAQLGIDGGDPMTEQATSALAKIEALLGQARAEKCSIVMSMVILATRGEFS